MSEAESGQTKQPARHEVMRIRCSVSYGVSHRRCYSRNSGQRTPNDQEFSRKTVVGGGKTVGRQGGGMQLVSRWVARFFGCNEWLGSAAREKPRVKNRIGPGSRRPQARSRAACRSPTQVEPQAARERILSPCPMLAIFFFILPFRRRERCLTTPSSATAERGAVAAR